MIPPKPIGDTPAATWFKWAHESIASLLTYAPRVPGALVSRTTRGIFIKPLPQAGGVPLPPGIEVREVTLCRREDNGDGTFTNRTLYMRGLFSVIYDKDASGNPVDSDGQILSETTAPALPDLTESEDASGFEIT